VNSPPPKPEVILTNFFAEPTVLLVPITSRVMMKGKTGVSLLANAAEAILISVFKRLIGRQLPIYCLSFPSLGMQVITL
jgi:hypothetical protein